MISENAAAVLKKRYLAKNEMGEPVETVEELFRRVARAVARADLAYDESADAGAVEKEFYDMMTELEFLPNSPTLMNAGRPLGQLSACFVLPVGDSMEEIFEALKLAALIHKSGGGTGFSFSRLRPAGSPVNSTGGVASGPISFMKVFNAATEAVKQGGTRRGANMGILRVDHPDILEFIDCKRNTTEITNFNISVGITEEFMKAVGGNREYGLKDPKTGAETERLNAREVYEKIVDASWQTGEPGIIFLDRVNRDNPVPSQGEIESTNPCGEQPLLPYESCNLGSVNLAAMLKNGAGGFEIDWDKLRTTVHSAVHFLDNVIDINVYPLPLIEETTKLTRKIGLGVMGWADALLYLGIPYNSDKGVALAEKVMAFIDAEAKNASAGLAEKRGAFPLFEKSTYLKKLRNATVTTIAPTGTLSIIAGVSSGVEPVFAYVYVRNIMDGTEFYESSPVLEAELKARGLFSSELMGDIAKRGGLSDIEGIPDELKRVFVCAHDISPEFHVRMQAAFQKYTDNAVSKTVNFPHDATREDTARVYELAHDLGLKGVTIYRDGSRDAQVLTAGRKDKAEDAAAEKPQIVYPRSRPEITMGFTEKVKVGCGNLYITVNYDEAGICEVFTNTGKKGGCPSQSEAASRLATCAFRSGVDPAYIIKQLQGIRCPSTIRQRGMSATSCPDAISRVISKVIDKRFPDMCCPDSLVESDAECPECSAPIEHESGCVICRQCGYSKCG